MQQSQPAWLQGPESDFNSSKSVGSPLIVDLDGDGIELTTFNAATTTTFFDMDGDSFAEQTAWVSADDGLLARDINANGTIDDVTELFGSPTIDGFAKLALLDDNGDLIINQYDAAWTDLVVWKDANGDAVTNSGELLSLSSLGIVSIDIAGVTASTSTISGNPISHTSTFRYDDDSTGTIVDAWFVLDQVNTRYVGGGSLNESAFFLPVLRGFGELSDLSVAMSQDNGLLNAVATLQAAWSWDQFGDYAAFEADVASILYEWAGVDAVSPSSRGAYVDARQLEFLEHLFGTTYAYEFNGRTEPTVTPGKMLTAAWEEVFDAYASQLITQLTGGALYGGNVSYNLATGELDGTFSLSQSAISALVPYASDVGIDTEEFFRGVATYIDITKGLSNVTATEEGWFDTALYDAGSSYTWDDVLDSMASGGDWVITDTGTSASETIDGSTGPDQLGGSAGYDTVNGYDGEDELNAGPNGGALYGGDGDDELRGGDEDDLLSSGDGGDYAWGDLGDDSYVFTSGSDVYSEVGGGGSDTIYLPSGITLNDLTFYRANADSLFITVGSLGDIEIEKFFFSSIAVIEGVEFSDSTTLDLTSISDIEFYGTVGDDILLGEDSLNETMYGDLGSDELRGYNGDDILDGGGGNDILKGGYGNDTYIFSKGFDKINDQGGTDSITIPAGFDMQDLVFLKDGGDVNVLIADLGQVRIQGQATNFIIESIYFEGDETTVNFSDVIVESRGGDGNDSLTGVTGASADNILNGMAGNDTLQGGAGSDTYIFSEGVDVAYETGGSADKLLFWEPWAPHDIDIYRQESVGYGEDDLVLADQNGNKITFESFFDRANGTGEIESVEFSDQTIWDLTTMNFEVWGTSGADNITVSGAVDRVYRPFGGNDIVSGQTGNDVFFYTSGLDTVTDVGGADEIVITGGITINAISIVNVGSYDTDIIINSGIDEINLNNFRYGTGNNVIETISFDDGFAADLASYASWLWGSSGNDIVAGNGNDNVLIGKDGNDDIDAGDGADHAHGGAGTDSIHGDGGADLLYGGAGDDVLYGDDGLDALFGGDGADTFMLKAASAFNDIDLISDFTTGDSDVVDIADVLDGYYTAGVDDITDFVQITDDGSDSTLAIDQDGTANGSNFVVVASILGSTGLTDEAALVTSGALVVS